MSKETVTITYLNRNGGGFAEKHTLPKETTVKQFLEKAHINPDDFTIRIVRRAQGGFTPAVDEPLQEGDRLSCVPLKIETLSDLENNSSTLLETIAVEENNLETELNDYIEACIYYGLDPEDPNSYETIFGFWPGQDESGAFRADIERF